MSGGTCQSFSDPSIFARVEDHETLQFITKQFWNNIPPTSVMAIEKLTVENEHLKKENEEIKKEILEVQNKINEMQKKLAEQSQIPQLQDYLFSAVLDDEVKYVGAGNFISFEKFHVNHGNTFDLSTGTFTTPLKGIYEFSFSGNSNHDEHLSIKVCKNNEEIHGIYTKNPNEPVKIYANLASSLLLLLDVGDTVRVKVSTGKLVSWEYGHTIFNGKLLKLM